MSDRKKAILIILCAALLVGLRALGGSWHFDDFYTIVKNEALRHPSNILRAFGDPSLFSNDPSRNMYRPVLVVSYILNYALTGESATGFLAVNLLIHCFNALLVFFLALRLSENDNYSSFAAGLIFAVHPAASEGVAFASARSATLAVFFVLAAMLSYLKWDRDKSPVALIGSFLLFMLALGAKEIGIVFIASVGLYHLFYTRGKALYRAASCVAAFIAVGAGYMMLRRAVMGVALAPSLVRSLQDNLLTQAVAMMHYLRLFMWPIHQSINPWFPVYSKFDLITVTSIATLAALCSVGLAFGLSRSPKLKVAGFGILFAIAAFAPESTIVPLNLIVTERRMIQPLIGVALVFGTAIGSFTIPRRRILLWITVACLASLTFIRFGQWKNEEAAWRWAVRVDPNWGLLINNVGLIYIEKPDTPRAIKMFELTIRRDPTWREARLNLGHVYASNGRYDVAMKYYAEALQLNPGYIKAATSYALVRRSGGDREGAKTFLMAYSREHRAAEVFYLLGVFFAEDGDPKTALRYMLDAIDIDPMMTKAVFAASDLFVETGEKDSAKRLLAAFIKVYPIDDARRREAEARLQKLAPQ